MFTKIMENIMWKFHSGTSSKMGNYIHTNCAVVQIAHDNILARVSVHCSYLFTYNVFNDYAMLWCICKNW